MTDKCVVLSTCRSKDEAQRIADHLIGLRLAACVNILPGATSVYRWQGKVETADELLLIIKTRSDLVAQLGQALRSVHSYDTPELIVLPILDGSQPYLAWLDHELQQPDPPAASTPDSSTM